MIERIEPSGSTDAALSLAGIGHLNLNKPPEKLGLRANLSHFVEEKKNTPLGKLVTESLALGGKASTVLFKLALAGTVALPPGAMVALGIYSGLSMMFKAKSEKS